MKPIDRWDQWPDFAAARTETLRVICGGSGPAVPPRLTDATGSRYYRLPDGRAFPSVTTILSVIGKPALINWAANTERDLVLEAAADLWEDVPLTPKMSRPSYLATLQSRLGKTKAHRKALAKASEIGSQVHALIEWNLRKEMGQTVGPEPVLVGDAALWAFMAWEDWRKSVKLTPKFIEQAVWSETHGYAGTMDLLAEVVLPEHGPSVVVLDWKVSRGIYPESSLQNAAYVQALIEMGHADSPVHGLIVRLPKITTDPEFEIKTIPAEQQAALFETFLHTKALWEWNRAQEQARRAQPTTPPAPVAATA